MGWPGDAPRPLVCVRMDDEYIATLDRLAEAEGLVKRSGEPNRSEMVRVLIAEALAARMRIPEQR